MKTIRCAALVLVIALLSAAIGSSTGAQGAVTSQPTPEGKDNGPTLAETAAWLETDGQALMHGGRIQLDRRYSILSVSTYKYREVKVKDCTLSWTVDYSFLLKTPGKPDKKTNASWVVRIILKDLDTGGLAVQSDTRLSDEPVYTVRIGTRAAVGATIVLREGEKAEKKSAAFIYVHDQGDGQRLVNAIKRAAILCGAPAGPF
jgi:hypothetical protein